MSQAKLGSAKIKDYANNPLPGSEKKRHQCRICSS